MKINELAKQLEEQINIKLQELQNVGEEYRDLIKKITPLEDKLVDIYKELKPVEYMIKHHNPQSKEFFDALGNLAETKKKLEKKK